jgi:hypothetical protein
VTLLEDAVHTHGGAFGVGSSLAIDDAYTLYLALRAVFPEALPINDPFASTLMVLSGFVRHTSGDELSPFHIYTNFLTQLLMRTNVT